MYSIQISEINKYILHTLGRGMVFCPLACQKMVNLYMLVGTTPTGTIIGERAAEEYSRRLQAVVVN